MNQTYNRTRDFLLTLYDKLPTRTHNPSIVEYAEKTIVPSGTYRGAKFEHHRAPQLKEPLSLLSPDSPYREVIIMTGAQQGKSTLGELTAMYYITQVPSEILYVSSTDSACGKWLERRIVPRAMAAGIQFKTEVDNPTSRKTGSTTYSKIFPGGNIDTASALSPSQLASETKRIVIGDETDRWKIALGEEGSVVDMIRARTQAWGNQAKIIWMSTPTTESSSLIYQLFLSGDQRFYHVPCPYCGKMQLMDFAYGRGFGLTWEYANGKINRKSIELICEGCGKGIKESSKHSMLNGGQWIKTAVSQYDYVASYNLNGLYSHMLKWYDVVVSYDKSQRSEIEKQSFENLVMGRVIRSSGSRPKASKLLENRGTYRQGDVPEGVLYLTAGADVQRGSKTDPENPPRIEMEVLGIGAGYKTWSIEYKVFEGDVTDPFGGAFEALFQYMMKIEFSYSRRIDNFRFPLSMAFIDSGDGDGTNVVYQFSQRLRNTFASKGRRSIQRKKGEKSDELTDSSFKRYRAAKISEDITLYEISTVYYKNQIYNNLKIPRLPIEPQKPGFCDFPVDYTEKYFDMLTSEDKMSDGSFESHGRRNESLDCRVYALCAADVFLDSEVLNFKSWAKSNGSKPDVIQTITHRTVIDEMTKATSIKKLATKQKSVDNKF